MIETWEYILIVVVILLAFLTGLMAILINREVNR